MPQFLDALWVNVSPSFGQFAQPLLNQLSQQVAIAEWQYCQTLDEPNSLEAALVLLGNYLKLSDHPIHLLGHGTGGLISLLYTARYPERVRSLTLLSVGSSPAIDWQTDYYRQLSLVSRRREILLTQMVYRLFGYQCLAMTQKYRQALDEDLLLSLSPHNLYHQQLYFLPERFSVPLLICTGEEDGVIDQNLWQGWKSVLKDGDRLWQCPKGRYFFHYAYPKRVNHQIQDFWQALPPLSVVSAHERGQEVLRP